MSKLISQLKQDLGCCQEEGRLDELRVLLKELFSYEKSYHIYCNDLILDEKKVTREIYLLFLNYKARKFSHFNNVEELTKIYFKISGKVNSLLSIEKLFEYWKLAYQQFERRPDKKKHLLRHYLHLEYSLYASLKYKLSIAGERSLESFLYLSVFNRESDAIGILLNKVSSRLRDESIAKSFFQTFPYLLQSKFKDSVFKDLQTQEKVTDKEDITLIKGFYEKS